MYDICIMLAFTMEMPMFVNALCQKSYLLKFILRYINFSWVSAGLIAKNGYISYSTGTHALPQ